MVRPPSEGGRMRYHILECESQHDRGGNVLEDSSPTLSPNEPTGGEQGSPPGARDSLVHLERRCQDLQSENATLKRELDYEQAKTEQILENMERQVERLQTLLVGMGPTMGMNTRSMGKRSGRGWARVGSIAAPILVCVIVAAALAVPASPPPWRYWNKGGTDGDRGGGTGGGGGLACTLALAPAPIQPPIDAEEAAARLAQRAADLSAALTNAFPGGSERGGSAEAEQREAARCGIARNVIHEALLERESQLINGTRDRAAALHFAGDPKNRDRILRNFGRMTHAIERFVLRDAGLGGHAALHIDEGAWNNARDRVAAHVSLHRQSVIVFHDADKANPERLSDLEEAFEVGYLVHQGRRVDCTGAVFILYTFLGASLSSHVCSDKLGNRLAFCSSSTHKDELVRVVKEQSQHVWPEWTFVARIRAIVPFP